MEENKKTSNPTIAQGWTLRDEFANSAIANLSVSIKPKTFYDRFKLFLRIFGFENKVNFERQYDNESDAEYCYLLADAMLKQREIE